MRYKIMLTVLLAMLTVAELCSSPMQMRTVVAVTGNAIEALSRNPVSVKISVHDNTGKKINQVISNAAEGGYYYVTGLFPGNTYTFKVVEDGFFSNEFTVSIPNTDKYIEISRDFLVSPLKAGWRIPLSVSPFEMNKTKLRFGASIVLDDVVNTLKNNPKVNFTIKAFPDNNNDAQKNIALTKARAESLFDYFIVNGINPSRISIEGSERIDPDNPPPAEKRAKGKRYIGSAYIIINEF